MNWWTKVNWFKIAQINNAGQIILALLSDAGRNALPQLQNPQQRLSGFMPNDIMTGLSWALGQIQYYQKSPLTPAQNEVVQQIRAMGGTEVSQQSPEQINTSVNTPPAVE
jgi:hypothetical protein